MNILILGATGFIGNAIFYSLVNRHNISIAGRRPIEGYDNWKEIDFLKNNDWDKAKKNRPNHVKKFLQERIAIKRFANENEISDVIDFLCSEKSSFCVGSCFLVDGGQGRVFYPTDF